MSSLPRVLILHATGTNRDREALLACEQAGGQAEIVHVNQLRDGSRRLADYQMLVLPGGMPGAEHLRDSANLIAMLKEQKAANRLYAAICAAPAVVLHHHGLLKNVRATCYPAMQSQLDAGHVSNERIFVHGDMPAGAEEALGLLETFGGRDDGSTDGTAEVLREFADADDCQVIIHEQNRGKGAALETGYAWALAQGYDAVLTLEQGHLVTASAHGDAETLLEVPQVLVPRAEELLQIALAESQPLHGVLTRPPRQSGGQKTRAGE